MPTAPEAVRQVHCTTTAVLEDHMVTEVDWFQQRQLGLTDGERVKELKLDAAEIVVILVEADSIGDGFWRPYPAEEVRGLPASHC